MYRRYVCGGGKGTDNPYDPQIGAAAAKSAETADRAIAFAEKYQMEVVAPLLRQSAEASAKTQGQLGELYATNKAGMDLSMERYKEFGIPAEQRYYDMVSKYSEPAEMERQAMAAKGDLGVAQANQFEALRRRQAAVGIDPTSPAAISAMTDASVMGAAQEASAMNRARGAARQLGMQLTADGANFGRGGQSGVLQFGAGAQGNAMGGAGVANSALGAAAGASSGMMQGFNTGLQGYGQNLNAYTSLGNTAMNAQAQQQAALYSGLGSMAGSAAGVYAAGGFSDVHLKENIELIGHTPEGLGIYRFTYVGDPTVYEGVMAQEVMTVRPEAVGFTNDGYMYVDYAQLG